jgi:hypothetical protein
MKISNPAVNYGQSTTPRVKYAGYVLDWSTRVRFGKVLPGPHPVVLTCYAETDAAAHQILHAKAKRDGWALGGVQNIHRV